MYPKLVGFSLQIFHIQHKHNGFHRFKNMQFYTFTYI